MIECKICGRKMKTLRKHLKLAHKMSVITYLRKFPNAPVVSPDYAEKMRKIILEDEEKMKHFNEIKKWGKGERKSDI